MLMAMACRVARNREVLYSFVEEKPSLQLKCAILALLLETLYIIPTIPAKGTADFGGDHPFHFLAEPLMPSRVASAACNRVKLLRVGVRVSGCKGLGFRVQPLNPKP